MNEKLEAIKEAIEYIQEHWTFESGRCSMDAHEFVNVTAMEGEVTSKDVGRAIEAIEDGEPLPFENIEGTFEEGDLKEVHILEAL